MKKRGLLVLACMISAIMLCTGLLTCLAAEDTEPLSAEYVTANETTETATQPTIVSRIWEYCQENETKLLTLAGNAVLFVSSLVIKHFSDKKTKSLAADLKIVKGDAAGTALAQTSVVGAMNGLIEGYNGMRQSYERYEGAEDDRNRLIGAVMVQNTALLEILATVYVNSKNLPQGVKDLINLKYANCQKALGDDQTLLAIVESVREKIGTATEPITDDMTVEV